MIPFPPELEVPCRRPQRCRLATAMLGLAVVALLPFSSAIALRAESPGRPNIIVILADDI